MNLVFPHTFVPWFRSVAPYMHAYRGKTFVVAMAGELIAAGKLNAFVQDLAILHSMGIKLVLVHGFRPHVYEQLAAKGHVSRFSHGLRITDQRRTSTAAHQTDTRPQVGADFQILAAALGTTGMQLRHAPLTF